MFEFKMGKAVARLVKGTDKDATDTARNMANRHNAAVKVYKIRAHDGQRRFVANVKPKYFKA